MHCLGFTTKLHLETSIKVQKYFTAFSTEICLHANINKVNIQLHSDFFSIFFMIPVMSS